jgi:hypothetical protein
MARKFHRFLCAFVHRFDRCHLRVGQNLSSLLFIGSRQTNDERHSARLGRIQRFHDALGDLVAARDAAEDVDEHNLGAGVIDDQLVTVAHAFGVGSAADVEKVREVSAGVAYRIHRRHG